MTRQRQHVRYQAEFPRYIWRRPYRDRERDRLQPRDGGCTIVSDLEVKNGARLTVNLQIPEQPTALTIQAATVQWILEPKFWVEFLVIQERERARLEQFLATQSNISA
jgi:hypothetical protein